jgi:hypothetical protein
MQQELKKKKFALDHKIPLLDKDRFHCRWIFQHDNDPKHKAKVNIKYLNEKGCLALNPFEILDWPSQSPDLNPIEHLWKQIKDQMKKRKLRPKNETELFQHIKEEWEKFPKERLEKLIDSMPRRCQAVIKNKGGPTKY